MRNSGAQQPSEREPLLGASKPPVDEQQRKRWLKSPRDLVPSFEVISPRYRWVPLLGCLIVFINEAEYFFKQVAMMRCIEIMYCIEYWNERDPAVSQLGRHIPETMCKSNEIQKAVARTTGYIMFVRMLCSLLGAIPLGWLADAKGRRVVIIMHKLNVVCSCSWQVFVYMTYPLLPVWAILFSGLPGLFGGNFDLGLAMLFASYTDVLISAEQRTLLFYLTTSMQFVGQALIPPIGGWLMNLDGQDGTPHIAMFVSLAAGFLALLIATLFFPETMKKTGKGRVDDNVPNEYTGIDADPSHLGIWRRVSAGVDAWRTNVLSAIEGVGPLNMLLLVLSMLFVSIGIKSTDWFGLVQYPVIKLHWAFSETTPIVSAQALITLLNFSVLIPAYTRLGGRSGLGPSSTSLLVMLISCLTLTTGVVLLGFSASTATFLAAMTIYTLGSGFTTAVQAFVAELIDKVRLARAMALLSTAATAGKMIASGLFPRVLALGLDSSIEMLKGLPFFGAGGLFAVAGMAVCVVAFRQRKRYRASEQGRSDAQVEA